MDPQPGWTTSEFWSTQILHLITAIITISSLTGHTPFDASGLQPLIPVAALVMSGVAQAMYSHGRSHVKGRSLTAAGEVLQTQAAVQAGYTAPSDPNSL